MQDWKLTNLTLADGLATRTRNVLNFASVSLLKSRLSSDLTAGGRPALRSTSVDDDAAVSRYTPS